MTFSFGRPPRIAYPHRHIDEIFSRIGNYAWLIVDDGDAVAAGLNVVDLRPDTRWNFAREYIRERRLECVVYNMDDDNFCYRLICNELRKVEKIAIFPVGNLGPVGVERPVIFLEKLVFWSAHFPQRA